MSPPRLRQAARHEEVLVGEETNGVLGGSALLEPVEIPARTAHPLPGGSIGLVPGAQALARRLDAPMVGRDAEPRPRRGRLRASCS